MKSERQGKHILEILENQLSFIFLIDELINQQSVSRMEYPLIKITFLHLFVREGLKKSGNFHIGGGQRGSFSTSIFLIFFAPHGLKITFSQ